MQASELFKPRFIININYLDDDEEDEEDENERIEQGELINSTTEKNDKNNFDIRQNTQVIKITLIFI